MVLDSNRSGTTGQHHTHLPVGPTTLSVLYTDAEEPDSPQPSLPLFNRVAAHSVDLDDAWHPAIHPLGAVLPALLAVSDILPNNRKPSGRDFLLAFNVGIEFQG
ncbi:cis-aconitate decarboxylase [Salmo salar]|uniref:Cis-aconitate decarboxylase n=1 Tax=Salmo salar TaxID=8030 RepID=A0ABM3FBH9_SALSA|nr:cis-aconitate decarboxylase-like [Salmo salar]